MAEQYDLHDQIHGINLVKGMELVGEFVENKRAFWRFPQEIIFTRKEFANFSAEVSQYHELIEAFSMGNGNNFFRLGGVRVIKKLLYCNIIKVLELYGIRANNDAAVEALSEFIMMTPCCTCIDLSSNGFSSKQTYKICNSLHNNSVILEFVYRNNLIDNKLCGAFKDVIRSNAQLEFLNLSANPFDTKGETLLMEGLKKNDSLKKLEYKHIKSKNQKILERLKLNTLNWREKFIRNLEKEETGKWNRSKLMFIGQGRAGKTSTVHRLLNKGFDSKQDSTVGASVSQTQTSTTQEQLWKTVQESDPEYLGTGMLGNQAGQLFAARNLVGKTDKKKEEALALRRNKGIQEGIADRNKLANARLKELEAQGKINVGVSDAAEKLQQEQQERDQAANKLMIEQEKLRSRLNEAGPGGLNQVEADAKYAQELQMREDQENMRKKKEEREDDTAKHYAETVFAAAREKRDTITFSLWDYGGQAVFYALHHLFLTKYGVYVLCVDLTEILNKPDVAFEYLSFWLNSVKLHAPTAPVLLVGTHLDALDKKTLEQLDEANTFIKTNFSEKFRQLTSLHPKYSFYPVDNKNNQGVNELRFDVERISRKQEFVTADVSIKWMFCLDKIMVKRDTGGSAPAWMKLADVKKTAASVKITSHEDLERMLTMFHELGVLVRLTGTEELRNLVTLDPQWLIDALCKVIHDEHLHGASEAELEKAGLVQEMNLLYKRGLASEDVMGYLWRDPSFKDHQNYLLDLMKYMVLISDWDFRDDKMYVIPSLLIPRPEDVDLFDEEHVKVVTEKVKKGLGKIGFRNIFARKKPAIKDKAQTEKKDENKEEQEKEITERSEEELTDFVIFDFSKVFLPMGVFQRLVCMCVSYSTNLGKAKKKAKVKEPELFSRWAKIWMGNDTILYLEQKENTIWLSVENPSTAPTCYKAVGSMLSKLNADLMGSGLDWDISMQQVRKTTYQKKGEKPKISKVVELDLSEEAAKKKNLDPWFKKKEEKDNAPKKEELLDLENFVDSF